MSRILLSIILFCAGALAVSAQGDYDLPDVRINPVRSYYWAVENGDTVKMVYLNDVIVFPELKFKNKKEEEYYWRTVRDVRKALPYAKLISETLVETYEYIETFDTQEEREAYLKKMESEVFKQYKPALKKFTRSQAIVLIKLVRRETNQSSYDMLKAFLGSFRASFWQGFGKLMGVNLKTDYNPDKDRKDAMIERIATAIEIGTL